MPVSAINFVQDAESAGGFEQCHRGRQQVKGQSSGVHAGAGGLFSEEEGEGEPEDEDSLVAARDTAEGEGGEGR